MEKRDWGRKTGAVLVLVIFVTALSCYAGGKLRREAAEKEGNSSAACRLEESEPQTKEEETESKAGDAESTEKEAGDEMPDSADTGIKVTETEAKESEAVVFGRGIEGEETLAEDIVLALKNGDTEHLVGVSFGEEFDYDLYEREGKECRRKDSPYDWYLKYLFDGKGHRFSGFYISPEGESFLGLKLGESPASVFIKAFGEPDACEKVDNAWDGGFLRACWYFDNAVLTVQEWKGYVETIEYNALGDIADGGGMEGKSDFELRMETKSDKEQVETICGFGFDEHEKDVFYPSEDDISGARDADEFVENYLEEQGFGAQMPDSVIYDEEGNKFAEAYRNSGMGRFVFVIYDGGRVCCAVRNLRGTAKSSHIVYSCDESGNTVQETLYDEWGMRASEASYRYHDGIPFPFITESWNLRDEGGWYFGREHKTWFYEDSVESIKSGKVKATGKADEWNVKKYLEYPCFFTYRSDGKLERIQEEIPDDQFFEEELEDKERYLGHMDFSYDNGILKKIDYHRYSEFYGTGDMGGTVDFDERGRMVHNHYYVTSGCHDEFYFYHEDEKRPWAVLDWCYDIWSVTVYR